MDWQAISKDIRRCQPQLRRQQNDLNYSGLTRRMIRLVLCVYIVSNYSKEITNSLALSLQTKRGRTDVEPLDVVALFDSWPTEDLLRLNDPESKQDRQIKQQAVRYLCSAAVARWVCDANFKQKVAVPLLAMALAYQRELRRHGEPENVCLRRAVTKKGRYLRLWAQRLRAQWSLRYGQLPSTSLCAVDLVSKACCTNISLALQMFTVYVTASRRFAILYHCRGCEGSTGRHHADFVNFRGPIRPILGLVLGPVLKCFGGQKGGPCLFSCMGSYGKGPKNRVASGHQNANLCKLLHALLARRLCTSCGWIS